MAANLIPWHITELGDVSGPSPRGGHTMTDWKFKGDFGVRAWIATLIIIPTMIVLSKLALGGHAGALATLTSMGTAVSGWYFYQRRKATQ